MQQLTGRVLDPNSPGWEAARHNFRSALDYDALVPAAIAFCQNAEDVQNAVRYARERGLPLHRRPPRATPGRPANTPADRRAGAHRKR